MCGYEEGSWANSVFLYNPLDFRQWKESEDFQKSFDVCVFDFDEVLNLVSALYTRLPQHTYLIKVKHTRQVLPHPHRVSCALAKLGSRCRREQWRRYTERLRRGRL